MPGSGLYHPASGIDQESLAKVDIPKGLNRLLQCLRFHDLATKRGRQTDYSITKSAQ
jgi:hypothetical protein